MTAAGEASEGRRGELQSVVQSLGHLLATFLRIQHNNAVQHHTVSTQCQCVRSHHLHQSLTKPCIKPASQHLRLKHTFPSCTP